jgi:hypothetical protein
MITLLRIPSRRFLRFSAEKNVGVPPPRCSSRIMGGLPKI